MDFDGNLRPQFVSRQENSLSFLYNCNPHDHYPPGLEMKYRPVVVAQPPHAVVSGLIMEKNTGGYYGNVHQETRKKRLTSEQLDSLESCFQEEVKLDPDRKMKLASELGLQPRQIAVWFQNRRARWKAKQLERLYDTLKQEYDVVSREKHKLQDEVLALKAMLKDQVSTGCTEISGTHEETVESTSVGNRSSGKPGGTRHLQMAEGSYVFNVDDYSSVIAPAYWGNVGPSYP